MFKCHLSRNDNLSPSHSGRKRFDENLRCGFSYFHRLRFCLNLFMSSQLTVRSKKSGAPSSSGLTGARLMTAPYTKTPAHFSWLNQLVTKQHFISCVMATISTTEHRYFLSVNCVLDMRNRRVAGEWLLCNNLPSFLCVSSWDWCLNSFSFDRLHWFCSSLRADSA